MKLRPTRYFAWAAVLLFPLWTLTGCIPADTANSSPPQPTASSPPQAELTALEIVVERLRGGQSSELQQFDAVDVRVNDQIAVKEHGHGLLRFPDRLLVELFHDTTLHIADVRLEPGKSVFIRMKQTLGTTLTQLNAEAQSRVEVDTDYATITSIEGETELLICHAKPVTCLVTLKGGALVQAQGQSVVVNEGEATYIFPGEAPRPALCAKMDEVTQWMDKKRGAEQVDPLGKVVAGWPQEPCSATPPGAVTAPLPASDGMVRVAGGQYVVGKPGGDDFYLPAQEITLADFWIDQYEVTNAQYQAFLDQTGHPAPADWPGEGNHPVAGVSWDDAAAYCAWTDKRLPTEAEWEAAARGPGAEPPLYPWGPDPSAGGQVDQLPLLDTYAVGSYAFNQSPSGAYDMAGNVWEWVGEPYGPLAEGYRMLRGGRHGLLKDMAYRQQAQPTDERFLPVTGFRCAASRVAGE